MFKKVSETPEWKDYLARNARVPDYRDGEAFVTFLKDDEAKHAEVFLRPEEVSLAIGKGGLNIKLATMLTDYSIDVYRDLDVEEEDIYLDEFKDEIDEWVIEALKEMGCTTAKAVLRTPREQLIEQADLEEDTVDNILAILREEFEE